MLLPDETGGAGELDPSSLNHSLEVISRSTSPHEQNVHLTAARASELRGMH